MKNEDWDDGRTVADMSCFDDGGKSTSKQEKSEKDEHLPEFSAGDKFAIITGTLKAALLIGLVFMGVLGIAIYIMTLIWR